MTYNSSRLKSINHLATRLHNCVDDIYEALVDGDSEGFEGAVDRLRESLDEIDNSI